MAVSKEFRPGSIANLRSKGPKVFLAILLLATMSAFQKGLKSFLRYRLDISTNPQAIDEHIAIYVDWYNNGKKVSTTGCYPEERYSGKRDRGWYERLVKALKLEHILPIPVVALGGDICP
jgi:hypothetical protein